MKKILLLAGILSVSSAHAINEDTVRNGLLGAVIGGVIGNNVGEGDSETGALIGGLSGIIFSQPDMRSHRSPRRFGSYPRHEKPNYVLVPVQVPVKKQRWVPQKTHYDKNGEVLFIEPGYYETYIDYETRLERKYH